MVGIWILHTEKSLEIDENRMSTAKERERERKGKHRREWEVERGDR